MDKAREYVRGLARRYVDEGDALGWFEELYAQADGDASVIPWADMEPNPNLIGWLQRQRIDGTGKRALVIGCGLGDDAEALADAGFEVVAFDIASTAIAWCRQRFGRSAVDYCVADLFCPPRDWRRRFDFVFEAYTLQVMPADIRRRAMSALAEFVARTGRLLVVARGRDDGDDADGPPWPVTKAELDQFVALGLTCESFEDYMDDETPRVRRFRAAYRAGATMP